MVKKTNDDVKSEEKVKTSAFLVQLLSALSICNISSLIGFVFAWPSYTLGNFTSNGTVLSKPMSSTEVSVLGSITNIGALIATPFCGLAIDTIGRKYSAMLFGIPFVLAWLIISMTTSVMAIITSIGLAGIGVAGQAISTIYISEISQDSIRGGLTSTGTSGFFFGLLFSYILGGHFTYYQVINTHLTLSVLYIVLLTLLKESPVFLVQKGREEEAARSISFYRRVAVNSKEVDIEIKRIKMQLHVQKEQLLFDKIDPAASKKLLMDQSLKNQPTSAWRYLLNSSTTKRALSVSVILMVSNILMGSIVLQVYAEPLFKIATPSIPSNLCAILLATDLLVSSIMCAGMVDKYGRKILMTTTSVGAGVCNFILATQLLLDFAPAWVTAVLIYSFCFVYNLGAATVPYVFTAEVFLPEVRGLCNSIVMAFTWITYFVTLMIFNPVVEYLGLGQVFYGFSVICFLTAVYSHFCMPETKGMSADTIQLLFLKERRKEKSREMVLSRL